MSGEARERDRGAGEPQAELDRLWCELWEGYQELLSAERTLPECTSKTSE
jgi:hypothetical protein